MQNLTHSIGVTRHHKASRRVALRLERNIDPTIMKVISVFPKFVKSVWDHDLINRNLYVLSLEIVQLVSKFQSSLICINMLFMV